MKTSIIEFRKIFKKHFPEMGNPHSFLEKIILAATGEIKLDLINFDNKYSKCYPYNHKKSLKDNIIKNQSKEAAEEIEKLF